MQNDLLVSSGGGGGGGGGVMSEIHPNDPFLETQAPPRSKHIALQLLMFVDVRCAAPYTTTVQRIISNTQTRCT
jgi:hypothetical protein